MGALCPCSSCLHLDQTYIAQAYQPCQQTHAQWTSNKRYTNFTIAICTCLQKKTANMLPKRHLVTYLAAATATTLERKQFRVSFPPNPPPEIIDKKTSLVITLTCSTSSIKPKQNIHNAKNFYIVEFMLFKIGNPVEIITLQDVGRCNRVWPNVCHKLCATMLQHVMLERWVCLAAPYRFKIYRTTVHDFMT